MSDRRFDDLLALLIVGCILALTIIGYSLVGGGWIGVCLLIVVCCLLFGGWE